MFYARKSQIVDHHLTYLHTQKVFTGQYWDEFALTCSLVRDGAKVLMLGLSLGGGIRPLLSSNKKIELTCVDFDQKSVEKCRDLYRECFPEIQFRSVIAEAREFLWNEDQKYDAIWFDIYDSDGYSSLAFDTEFINSIQNCLTPDAVLLVNSYGLPNQFSPCAKNDVQHHFASALTSKFGYLATIPFRRNMTFVVSSKKPTLFLAEAHPSLNAMDRFTFEGIQKKLCHQIPFVGLNTQNVLVPADLAFGNIDAQMRQCWSDLRTQLQRSGLELRTNTDLISLVQNQERCEKAISYLIHNNDLAVCFVPILAAGESHLQQLQIDWLFDWTVNNQQFLAENLKAHYILIWMTQLWTLIIHPHGRYKRHYFRFLSMMQNLH